MRERGILFSAPMVRALLAGTKTQTRRLFKADPFTLDALDRRGAGELKLGFGGYGGLSYYENGGVTSIPVRCPYGEPGDRLWVRETWYCDDYTAGDFKAARVGYVSEPPTDAEFIEQWRKALDYRATHDCNAYEAGCPCSDDDGRSSWRPSIFMPRWASRITLEVVGVRVERLHSITEDDAKAEGVEPRVWRHKVYPSKHAADIENVSYREGFADLWTKINGDGSWGANPWVWAVEFKQVEASS